VSLMLRRALRRERTWRAVSDAGGASLRPAWVVLLEYRVLWYAAADAVLLSAVSSLAVIGGLDVANEALCIGSSAAVVVLLVAQLVVLCVVRPYTTLFSLVQNVFTTALTCVSVGAQLAFVATSYTSTSGLWLVDASAACNLLVLGLTLVKMVLDAWELCRAIKRRVQGSRMSTINVSALPSLQLLESDTCGGPESGALDGLGFEAPDDANGAPANSELCDKSDDSNISCAAEISDEIVDGMFWDDGGLAIGTSHAEVIE
jgi:hypothetical protein